MIPVVNPLRNPVRMARQAKDVPQYFTRNSIAYTSDGEQVAANTPRFEQGRFGQAVMVEEGTTNLVPSDIATWSKYKTVVIAINGYYEVKVDTSTDTHYTNKSFAASAGVTYTGSVYVKKGLARYIGLSFSSYANWEGGVGADTTFDLETGTITEYGTPTASIQRIGDWYRLSITCKNNTSITFSSNLNISFRNGPSHSYGRFAGDGELNVYVKFPQLEAKLYATSFIDGTRAAETLTIPTAGVLNPQEGTIEFWTYLPVLRPSGYQPFVATDNLLIAREYSGADANKVRVVDGEDILISNAQLQDNTWYYIAYTWSMAGRKLFINGSLVATNAKSEPIAMGVDINIGSWAASDFLDGYIESFRISTRARSDTEISEAYKSNMPLLADDWTTAIL